MRKKKVIIIDKSVKNHISRMDIRRKYHISVCLLEKEFGECAVSKIELNGQSSSISLFYNADTIGALVKAFEIRFGGAGIYEAKRRRIKKQYVKSDYIRVSRKCEK